MAAWIDDVLMRITEIFLAFPFLLAALTSRPADPAIGRTIWPPTIALMGFGWMTYARVIRGDILTVRERDYVLAARVIGVKDSRISQAHFAQRHLPHAGLASLDVGNDRDLVCRAQLPGRGHRGGLCRLGPDHRLCPRLDHGPDGILVHRGLPGRWPWCSSAWAGT